jgi:hypothetical protein
MTKQKSKGGEKLSYGDVIDVLTIKCRNSDSEKVGPITNAEVQAMLKIEKDIDVSDQTIRNKGLRKHGYFEKRWPEICSFVNFGDTRMRGMIIKKEKWLDEVAE